jgi:hypothetical protein
MQEGPPRKRPQGGEGKVVVGHQQLFLVDPEHSGNGGNRSPGTALHRKSITESERVNPLEVA